MKGVTYLDAEFCGHDYPDEGDDIHVAGDPVDMICLASPVVDNEKAATDAACLSCVMSRSESSASRAVSRARDIYDEAAALLDPTIPMSEHNPLAVAMDDALSVSEAPRRTAHPGINILVGHNGEPDHCGPCMAFHDSMAQDSARDSRTSR